MTLRDSASIIKIPELPIALHFYPLKSDAFPDWLEGKGCHFCILSALRRS
jgi:hypothetical protein